MVIRPTTLLTRTMQTLIAFTLSLLPFVTSQGADGNPHHWDRRRRCDQTQYTPACGICEGTGGIPYGDQNNEIHLTSCSPITTNVTNPIHPIWGEQFTAQHYNEVLIGPKTDPFCFNSFPSNSSVGKLCYRADSGRQVYDAVKSKALRYDLNVKTVVGNVTTEIIHQNRHMWIINHLPWYAANVHQCICTNVHQGSDATQEYLYPVTYNWTDQMFFVGREDLGIEYTGIANYSEIVDHWAFGPHHVWSTPGTGQIRRMWQPFNGLEVFTGKFNRSQVDESLFEDIPPALCKKGGAAIRIKCTDEGYPVNATETHDDGGITAAAPAPTKSDITRAIKPKPSKPYRGNTFTDMSNTLNRWLTTNKHIETTSCEEWTAKEIQNLQATLYLVRDETFNSIYENVNDNRKLRMAMDDIIKEWSELALLIKQETNQDKRNHLIKVHRDGHCHEAVMWYVHHITEDMKVLLSQNTKIRLPLLSDTLHSTACNEKGPIDNSDDQYVNAKKRVCDVYKEQVTCASCHSDVTPPGHEFLKN